MKAITELRSAISAELEEITKHYRGILDHLDALAQVFEKRPLLNQIQDEIQISNPATERIKNKPGKRERGKISAQIKEILSNDSLYTPFNLQTLVRRYQATYGSTGKKPSEAIRSVLGRLVKQGNLKIKTQGRGRPAAYTLVSYAGLSND